MGEQIEKRLQETTYQHFLDTAEKLKRGEITSAEFAEKLTEKTVMEFKDPLTGLFNRKFFNQVIDLEVDRAERHKEPLALAMLDIDNFKGINDRYGHPVGDEVLTAFGELIRENIRVSDIAARFGGEEVAILLPVTNKDGADDLAKRLLANIHEVKIKKEEEIKITFSVSIGVAGFEKGMTPGELVDRADKALYLAKGKGKNRVQFYDEKPGK